MIRKETSLDGPMLGSRMQNLAFSWDHFLFDSLAGELESGEDEILSTAKSLEKTDNGITNSRISYAKITIIQEKT